MEVGVLLDQKSQVKKMPMSREQRTATQAVFFAILPNAQSFLSAVVATELRVRVPLTGTAISLLPKMVFL